MREVRSDPDNFMALARYPRFFEKIQGYAAADIAYAHHDSGMMPEVHILLYGAESTRHALCTIYTQK